MLRVRFVVTEGNPRPVKWPPPYPFWRTGYNHLSHPIVVAYVDSGEQIFEFWPDADKVEILSQHDKVEFTSRFPRPDWWKG